MAFNYKYLVDIYEMALEGMKEKDMARKFKVTPMCFSLWKKKLPSVKYAINQAKKRRMNQNRSSKVTWNEYIGTRLSPEVAAIWNDINKYDNALNGYAKIEEILKDKGKNVRQELFVTALMSNNFNTTTARRKVNISKRELDNWMENDPEFIQLVEEIECTKKDFFEEHLVKLVKAGDSPATIMTNRTINRDRGYGESVQHNVSGMIGHVDIKMEELDLPLDVQRVILHAIKQREKALMESNTKVIPSRELVSKTG